MALLSQRIRPEDVDKTKNELGHGFLGPITRQLVVLFATEGDVEENEEREGRIKKGPVVDTGGACSSQPRTGCPLIGFDPAALRWSIPPRLVEIEKFTRGVFLAERVWVTHLAIAVLLDSNECVLRKSRQLDSFDETAVDSAIIWLDAQVRARGGGVVAAGGGVDDAKKEHAMVLRVCG